MGAASLTRPELAKRLSVSASSLSRLFSGKTRWSRITPLKLAGALKLNANDRARLLELCASPAHARRAPRQSPPASGSMPRRRRGRPAREAGSAVGALLGPLLTERGMTRADLAEALGVQVSTVTRLMNGDHASSHAISAQGVSDALGLRGIPRREFIQQALALGAFALVGGQTAPPTLRYRGFDLERFNNELSETRGLLNRGLAAQALQQSRELYTRSMRAPFPRTNARLAPLRIEAALLLGLAQEATLTWGKERASRTVETYNHIDSQILSVFAPAEFAHYYARLYERRAPHYRELADYNESIRQFSLAIELFMPHVDDVGLLVTLLRNRAHVWAVQGKERQWRSDLEMATREASRAPGMLRAQLEGLIMYSEAEGYKRLAEATPAGAEALRRSYAKRAIASFQSARTLTVGEAESHHLLLNVSMAQSHLWLDADESANQARALYPLALSIFPSLASKLTTAIERARVAGAR